MNDYNTTNTKRSIIILIIFVLFIVIRYYYDADPNIIYIIATMNIISLTYVYLGIYMDIKGSLKGRINYSNLPQQIKERKKKQILSKAKFFYWLVYIILICIYLLYVSSILNDIFAMISLVLSLVDDSIVNMVNSNYKI